MAKTTSFGKPVGHADNHPPLEDSFRFELDLDSNRCHHEEKRATLCFQRKPNKSIIASLVFLFAHVLLYAIVRAQDDRAPHGLAYVGPAAGAISPEAYAFFNPSKNATTTTTTTTTSTQFSAASSVQSNVRRGSVTTPERGVGSGGGVAGILIGFLFFVVLGLGVYFVVITRKRNCSRANAALPIV